MVPWVIYGLRSLGFTEFSVQKGCFGNSVFYSFLSLGSLKEVQNATKPYQTMTKLKEFGVERG